MASPDHRGHEPAGRRPVVRALAFFAVCLVVFAAAFAVGLFH
ncbi:MAG: hypothetical protein ACR2NA_08145 [Solirubrobacterales bacterium]